MSRQALTPGDATLGRLPPLEVDAEMRAPSGELSTSLHRNKPPHVHVPGTTPHTSLDSGGDFRSARADAKYTDLLASPPKVPDSQHMQWPADAYAPAHMPMAMPYVGSAQQAVPSPVFTSTSPRAAVDDVVPAGVTVSSGGAPLSTDGSLLLKPGSTAPPVLKLRESLRPHCVYVCCGHLQRLRATLWAGGDSNQRRRCSHDRPTDMRTSKGTPFHLSEPYI
jgi:hypothetical protein